MTINITSILYLHGFTSRIWIWEDLWRMNRRYSSSFAYVKHHIWIQIMFDGCCIMTSIVLTNAMVNSNNVKWNNPQQIRSWFKNNLPFGSNDQSVTYRHPYLRLFISNLWSNSVSTSTVNYHFQPWNMIDKMFVCRVVIRLSKSLLINSKQSVTTQLLIYTFHRKTW